MENRIHANPPTHRRGKYVFVTLWPFSIVSEFYSFLAEKNALKYGFTHGAAVGAPSSLLNRLKSLATIVIVIIAYLWWRGKQFINNWRKFSNVQKKEQQNKKERMER